MEEETRPKPKDEQADFVMSFVEHSSKEGREDMEEIWDEVEDNFLVRPFTDHAAGHVTSNPLGDRYDIQRGRNNGFAVLKDPETHQQVMTIASAIVLGVMPEPGYVRAKRVGFEDIHRAKVVGGLIEYSDRLPGAYINNLEWVLGACVYGTGIKEIFWDYIEQPRRFRNIGIDPFTGEPVDETQELIAPVYDDVREETFDVRDFFPDPGSNRIESMLGAVRRFKITGAVMRARAEQGLYDPAAVESAVSRRARKDTREERDKPGYTEQDMSKVRESHPDFIQETGYRFIGTVPWRSPDGFQRREIVVIGGERVRNEPWFGRIPWFDIKITPRLNSFWGISPGEIVRYDQDFADVTKMMLADAVVRLVHPPHVYNRHANVDLAKLRAWRPRVPIGVEGDPNNAIGQARYDPQLQPAFSMYAGVKQQMREGSGALDVNQGLGAGTKRQSASEAVGTFERAAKRPELFAQVVEREYLPPGAKYKLKLYQEYLEDDEDLQDRIGESNTVVQLTDIMPDFDIQYIGTRMAGSKQDQIAVMREIISAGANPMLAPLIPWVPLFQMFLDKSGSHELAAMVGNPQMVKMHLMLNRLSGPENAQSGNNNGTVPSNPSPMTLPAQAAGSESF